MRPITALLVLGSVLLQPGLSDAATFDWGTDCSYGIGDFQQPIGFSALADVGVIPEGKRSVTIALDSATDVDVQLIDAATGTEIIAWPNGLLNGATEDCTTYEGVTYCWSGYNGNQQIGGYGQEWIEVRGDTNRELIMKAYGYAAGDALVEYSYAPIPTCNEIGDGEFNQYVSYQNVVTVGTIPTGKVNVTVELDAGAGKDVDVQLYAGNVALVQWPNGMLADAGPQTLQYQGMTIEWSGYNGIGGNWGHEEITITGMVSTELTMKAYGFQAGSADVTYDWGAGAGATCLGIANLQCDPGLMCKGVQIGVSDPAGECHTDTWCGGEPQAQTDCSNLLHIAVPGFWGCEEFTCGWQTCNTPGPDYNFVSTSPSQCALIRYTCAPGQEAFSNGCGCGCKDL